MRDNMKKFIPIVIVCSIVLSGLGAAAFAKNVSIDKDKATNNSASVIFSSVPLLSEKDGFVEIQMDGTTTQIIEQNKPVLPIYVKTYQIPFRSTNIQVTCTVKDIRTMTLTMDVIPARVAPLSKISERKAYVMDSSVYGSAALYPDAWYSYDLGAGRNENDQQVTFVKVICYPVRYSPLNKQIDYVDGFDISISYEKPTIEPRASSVSYDLVVIGPAKFESSLQPLIDFKNGKGMNTTFKSLESILSEYTGYDQPEQIKKFIYSAYENWSITYVLLAGGVKNHFLVKDKDSRSAGWTGWRVPVRYVSMPQEDDEGCLSDLYYGCIYNDTGAFDSWDSNGDGVYAAWNAPGVNKDKFDLYPEVYVSRIPAANTWEVKRIVSKIVTYESTGPEDKPWFNNFVGVGGKTFDYYGGKPDGEYLNDLAYNMTKQAFPDLKLVPVYSTNRGTSGLVPDPKGIAAAFNQGAGFVDMEGHGSPARWDTIWFDGTYPEDWCGGIGIDKFIQIKNADKLPVVIVGGCHNAMYNVTTFAAMIDKDGSSYFGYGYPVPACFCYGLLLKPLAGGGAIASTGCTGYGFGSGGDPNTLSGALEMNFFWNIGNNSVTNLAKAHSLAISKYVSEHTIGQIDAFCITNWALFGDPSLKIGGYSS
jgi:hypothetical protein